MDNSANRSKLNKKDQKRSKLFGEEKRISDLCRKMSNPAFTSVVFVGDRREVRSLYNKMKRLRTTGTAVMKTATGLWA